MFKPFSENDIEKYDILLSLCDGKFEMKLMKINTNIAERFQARSEWLSIEEFETFDHVYSYLETNFSLSSGDIYNHYIPSFIAACDKISKLDSGETFAEAFGDQFVNNMVINMIFWLLFVAKELGCKKIPNIYCTSNHVGKELEAEDIQATKRN